MAVVEGEEEDGEEDGDVLVGGAAVGRPQQLQTCYCDHQSTDPGKDQPPQTNVSVVGFYITPLQHDVSN